MVRWTIWVWICGLSLAVAAPAQIPPTVDPNALTAEITRQLASLDAASQSKAIEGIHKLLEVDPSRAANALRNSWLKTLADDKRYDEVDALALQATLVLAGDTSSVEALQQMRIGALLKAGQADQALAAAKSLYNVCSMPGTANAMLLVAQCLNAAHGGDDSFTERFRAEQMAGANPPATRAATRAQNSGLILAQIQVNAGPYEGALAKMTGEDFNTLLARGNLLLLADRPRLAMSVLERAYGVATEGQLPTASEAIARCMRAQDGTIGRANAWILSIRPKAAGR